MAKANQRKVIKVNVDLYPLVLVVMINDTDEKCFKNLTKIGITEEDARTMNMKPDEVGRTVLFGRSLGVIRINRKIGTPEFHSTLNHELLHIVLPFLTSIGMKYDHNSEEAFAYLMGYLSFNIYKKL